MGLGFRPTASFKYANRKEKEYRRKGNEINERIITEDTVGKISVSRRDGKTVQEIADRFAIDKAVERAYKKQENDRTDRTERRNKLVFRQRRNKNTLSKRARAYKTLNTNN